MCMYHMAKLSSDSDSEGSSDDAGETRGGSDAEPTIGTLAPHDVPYAGIGADGSSLDLPSPVVEDEGGGNLDSTRGEGDEIANSMSRHLPLEEKDKEHKDKGEKQEEKKKDEADVEVEDTKSGSKDVKPDTEDDLKLKLKEKKEKDNRNTLLLLTTVLVMSIPVVVWRSMNQPPELILWRLSLLLCTCCVIWSGLLDVGIVPTMLHIFSSSFSLALYVDVRDTRMGALIVHLNCYIAAGMLGYALAKRRERDGTEVSAAAAAARNPSDKSKAEDLLYYQTLGGVYTVLFTLGFAVPVAWVLWHRVDFPVEELIIYVLALLSCILMLWILFVGGMLLQGALIQEAGICLLLMYFVCGGLVYSMVSVLIGEIGAMVFISAVMLGFPGFFGYSLGVYTSFKLRLNLQLKVDKSTKELPTRSSPERADEIFAERPLEEPYLETAPSSSPGVPSPPGVLVN